MSKKDREPGITASPLVKELIEATFPPKPEVISDLEQKLAAMVDERLASLARRVDLLHRGGSHGAAYSRAEHAPARGRVPRGGALKGRQLVLGSALALLSACGHENDQPTAPPAPKLMTGPLWGFQWRAVHTRLEHTWQKWPSIVLDKSPWYWTGPFTSSDECRRQRQHDSLEGYEQTDCIRIDEEARK